MRDPRIDPQPGDILRSCYVGQNGIDDRRVISVSPCNVKYETKTATGKTVERCCLPHTWVKWCRGHRASVVN